MNAHIHEQDLWLIGAGPMAQEYARVLRALNRHFKVIGLGETSATAFQQATGTHVQPGGLDGALMGSPAPATAIVAVGVEQLAPAASALIRAGCKRILLEKPGGLDLAEITALDDLARMHQAEVLLAYNRRFYASVQQACEYVIEDGGLLSAQFEFTEWAHKIGPLTKSPRVKEHWLLGNSTHVIDLAFFLCGKPTDWHGWFSGTLDWHPTAARFCGAGRTDRGVLFSYHADWQAPGRWGLELLTRRRRLILRPLEQLKVTSLGSVTVEPVEINDALDREFKPGLYQQSRAFLTGDDVPFCTLAEQVNNVALYSQMAGYS